MADRRKDYDTVIAMPFGRLGIRLRDGALSDIDFVGGRVPLRTPRSALGREVRAQLQAYLRNPHFRFTLPLTPGGSAYQRRVWRALRRIPVGTVMSYGKLASRLRSSARAVGGACRANPIPIVVPCHRVVAARGMGGFMGKRSGTALQLKRWLLDHERSG